MADQRLCVVTGGGSGLGRAISEGPARAGHRVVLFCRDPQRGERARQEIAAMTGNPAVELVVADLAVRTATREAARAIREGHPAIDVLVHNAGIWPTRLERTDEGLERSFAINHLAPFILNAALADRLGRG